MDAGRGSEEGWKVGEEEDEEEGGPGRTVETRAVASREETGFLVSTPEVCGQAVEDRKMRTLSVALDYTDAEIMVELVHKDNLQDPPGEPPHRRCLQREGVSEPSQSEAEYEDPEAAFWNRCGDSCRRIERVIEGLYAGERRSRRSRRGRAALRVSAATTLQALKKQIAQELGVHPLNAIVHICRSDGRWHQLDKDANMKGD